MCVQFGHSGQSASTERAAAIRQVAAVAAVCRLTNRLCRQQSMAADLEPLSMFTSGVTYAVQLVAQMPSKRRTRT